MEDFNGGRKTCCRCEAVVSEPCHGYHCRRCSQVFFGGFGFGPGIGGKFSYKIHPSDSPEPPSDCPPPDSPEPRPRPPNCVGKQFDGPSLQAVSVCHSSGRSDDEETDDSAKNFSPFSLDTSDVDSSSVSTRHEFYRLRQCVQQEDHGPPGSPNGPMAVLKSPRPGPEDMTTNSDSFDTNPNPPLDFENNGLIWLPLPPDNGPDDGPDGFFSYSDDDEDEMGDGLMGLWAENRPMPEDGPTRPLRGHFRALVSQLLLQSEFAAAEEWLDVVTSVAWQAANFVKPDTSGGGSMDPGDYVKIKCVASGTPSESVFVKGVVCTKNIKHKRMTSQYKNPRILILGGSLEYQRSHNQLASIDTLLQQEIDHLKTIISRIEAHRPNVLLVEKSVASYAQEYLLAKDISLVLNVKRSLLERIARCTGAPITPSVDKISTTRLGRCELFRLERVSEEHEAANHFNKKPSKTLMFFDGCPRRSGCTVLLKGSSRAELKKVKSVVQYAIFAAYHLSLETSFLADEGASIPKTTVLPPVEPTNADNATPVVSPKHEGRDHRDSSPVKGSIVNSPTSPVKGSIVISPFGAATADGPEPVGLEPTDTNQSILVSFSSRCVVNGAVCERSRLLRIKFYGRFDKPLGRYLRDDLFDQAAACRACKEPAEAHVVCYTHRQGNLTINVRRIPALKLPGEKDGKIWMWHRCLRCRHVDGVPPATRRVVMSDAAWGLSFGKFLELSFSNHATANRVAGCGHSLQRDCLRFYGLGSMVVFFRYSPIDILSVHLPPSVLRFDSHVRQDWLTKEAAELSSKTEAFYEEVSDVLDRIERELSGSSKQVEELKELLVKERNAYVDLLRASGPEMDVFELNRLRHSLVVGSRVWDHRLVSLSSLAKRSSSSVLDDSGLDRAEREKWDDVSPRDLDVVFEDPLLKAEETLAGPASVLSDKIDSAWAGPGPLKAPFQNPHFRRLTSSPARVYSFDSAVSLQERAAKEPPPPSLAAVFRGSGGGYIRRSYSQVFPVEDVKLDFLSTIQPSIVSAASFLPEGMHLMLPGWGGSSAAAAAVIAVYDNEPTSIIAYALMSRDHEEWVSNKPRNVSDAGRRSLGSVDLDYGGYGAADDSSAAVGSFFADPKPSPHLTVAFDGGSAAGGSGGKVKFSVTCYFARRFDALRRRCCRSEADYVRSLGRCRRWSAQGGKSNVYFARSFDERFIVKQVTKTELESFEEFAPEYFKYMTDSLDSGSPTCLAKVVGIYQVTVKHSRGGKEAKMHVMVMENLFFERRICRVYDLKGSARARYNSDMTGANKTLLDMNLLEALRTKPIFLGSKAKRSLERAVWNDTSFLASIDVMDYSLLVGVDDENKQLVLGIIDFMRQYTWDKQLETWVKASGILGGPKNASPTIVSPMQYKRRFRKAMTSYFLTVPDQWSS